MNSMWVRAFYPNYFSDRQISYVCLAIIRYLNEAPGIAATAIGLTSDRSVRNWTRGLVRAQLTRPHRLYRDAIPGRVLSALATKYLQRNTIERIAESTFLKTLHTGDVAYMWPGASLNLYEEVKRRGCSIVAECINTAQSTSKGILDTEYRRLGLPATHGITCQEVACEAAQFDLADYIFSPSPAVTQSLTDTGIDDRKVLKASYGLRKSELLGPRQQCDDARRPTAIFVGSICVRKGIHLLLDAWEAAGVDARLRIVGRIAPDVRDLVNRCLSRNDSVEHVPFVQDLRPIYRNADFFILPSLEEGSPLVTYLALGASLPVIVSPMGGGGIIQDGAEGLVVDPHDRGALIAAIRRMSMDRQLREQMSRASWAKADRYTWDQVTAVRAAQLVERFSSSPSVP